MKTEDLIRAIAADNASRRPPVARTLALALLAGATIAALLFHYTLGVRGDFWWSIAHSPRFVFKFVFTLAVAAFCFVLVRHLARPESTPKKLVWMLGLPALMLAAAVGLEMLAVPSEHWPVYALGQNAVACMTVIPLLSLAPLVAVLYAARQGATSYPAVTGAIGGLLAAGVGATFYASRCADDSPLFVGLWYPLAMAAVVAAGALAGSRLLKW